MLPSPEAMKFENMALTLLREEAVDCNQIKITIKPRKVKRDQY